jgi:hypothetical protein
MGDTPPHVHMFPTVLGGLEPVYAAELVASAAYLVLDR